MQNDDDFFMINLINDNFEVNWKLLFHQWALTSLFQL